MGSKIKGDLKKTEGITGRKRKWEELKKMG